MPPLVYLLPSLACPISMGAMMWFMLRSGKQQAQPDPAGDRDVVALRAEIEALRGSSNTSLVGLGKN